MKANTFKEPEIKEVLEEVKEKPIKKKKKANPVFRGLQSVMDGTILTKDRVVKSLPFFLYISVLAILYISNSYYAEKKVIEIEKVKKELKELRSESITSQSDLMFDSRQSEVLNRIFPYGIKESLKPPSKIYTATDTLKKVKSED